MGMDFLFPMIHPPSSPSQRRIWGRRRKCLPPGIAIGTSFKASGTSRVCGRDVTSGTLDGCAIPSLQSDRLSMITHGKCLMFYDFTDAPHGHTVERHLR